MITRIKELPTKSFILLGPRGVGKSTLIKQKLTPDLEINLLRSREYLSLHQNPDQLLQMTEHLPKGAWVFIDEVQRVPEILNLVHEIYETRRLNFALTGSSARKIKRGGGNLLAGRALQIFLHPFAYPEFRQVLTLDEAVLWGTLPLVANDEEYRKDTLATYVETYLREELVQEGIIRKIDSFLRFLKVAGTLNGQALNYDNIGRESHIGRTTVQNYFDILIETLIGFELPAYQPGLKVKEIARPKFYFFDSGVARACADLLAYEVDSAYKGFLFETLMINQVRSYNDYSRKQLDIYYYGISGGAEIDLVIETKKRSQKQKPHLIAIEFKSGVKFKSEWIQSLKSLHAPEKVNIEKKYCVYQGTQRLTVDGVHVLNAEIFLKLLFQGDIF